MRSYKNLHKSNPAVSVLLPALGASESAFECFRDIFTSRNGLKIYVLTQTGGSERANHSSNWQAIRSMSQYESDRDDAFQPTYAWINFRPLEQAVSIVRSFAPDEDPILEIKVRADRAVAALLRDEAHERPPKFAQSFLTLLEEHGGMIEL